MGSGTVVPLEAAARVLAPLSTGVVYDDLDSVEQARCRQQVAAIMEAHRRAAIRREAPCAAAATTGS